jgi:putative heme-binding domain-containing protein
LWALIGSGSLTERFHLQLFNHKDATFRAWSVRAAGTFASTLADPATLRMEVEALRTDPSRDVLLQVVIALRKFRPAEFLDASIIILSRCEDDKLIPSIIWQNLQPLLDEHAETYLKKVRKTGDISAIPNMADFLPRVLDRILANKKASASTVAELLTTQLSGKTDSPVLARQCLQLLVAKIQTGELSGEPLLELKHSLLPPLRKVLTEKGSALVGEATLLAAALGDKSAFEQVRALLTTTKDEAKFLSVLELLVSQDDVGVIEAVSNRLGDPATSKQSQRTLLATLGRLTHAQVASTILAAYPKLEPDLQPQAIEVLTQRPAWSKSLLEAIGKKTVAVQAINLNHVERMLLSKDADLKKLVEKHIGTVRLDRNEAREKVIADVKTLLRSKPGDSHRGVAIFKKVCAQCHKMHGEGVDVGPDITANGRASVEQLLSNVLDPNRVIGVGYQARLVLTKDGRLLTGLTVEENEQRIILKIQGGKLETIARKDVEETKLSPLSMMPEDLEKQLKPEELIDLFAYLVLDKPPSDPTAKRIPNDSPK